MALDKGIPLLSICVPTYNRAELLRLSLTAILEGVGGYKNIVQVVVSDNCSSDNTEDVVSELKQKYDYLEYYRNSENIGANRNFFLLSDKYAKGRYFWMLGDDDILDPDAVMSVVKTLQEHTDIVFLGLSFRVLSEFEFKNGCKIESLSCRNVTASSMVDVVDMMCDSCNMLSTFISCNIVNLEKYNQINKTIFHSESWIDYQSLFPHTHTISSVIDATDKAAYIKEPIMSVIHHEKDWDNGMILIHLYFIIQVYRNFIKQGYKASHIKRSKDIIIKSGIYPLIKSKCKLKIKLYFIKFAFLEPIFYKTFFQLCIRKLQS